MNQQNYYQNQESESQNNGQNYNQNQQMCNQFAQNYISGQNGFSNFNQYQMGAANMMEPAMLEQWMKFMQDQMMRGGDQQQFFNQDFMMKNNNDFNGDQYFNEFMNQEMMKQYNQGKYNNTNGVKKIGSYSIDERAKKIKKYKDKLQRWKQAHPISRSFSGRSQVANKKKREKGRFVKNSELEQMAREQELLEQQQLLQQQQQNSEQNLDMKAQETQEQQQQNNNQNGEKDVNSTETIQYIQDKPFEQGVEEETAAVEIQNDENQNQNLNNKIQEKQFLDEDKVNN